MGCVWLKAGTLVLRSFQRLLRVDFALARSGLVK